MLGKKSYDTKAKMIDYIHDYALANCNIYLDKEELDSKVNIEYFSLQVYLFENKNIIIDDDLIIQSFQTMPERCLAVKCIDQDIGKIPSVYLFNQGEEKRAKGLMAYMINESLIEKYSKEDRMQDYDKEKKDVLNFNDISFSNGNVNYEMYNGGLFLEELLNNSVSLENIKNNKKTIKI